VELGIIQTGDGRVTVPRLPSWLNSLGGMFKCGIGGKPLKSVDNSKWPDEMAKARHGDNRGSRSEESAGR
jgi:hypothetical protein